MHGIGEQRPKQSLVRFVRAFLRSAPAAQTDDPADPTELRIGGRTIRLYEVYWADLLSGKVVRNSFDFEAMLALPWFPGLNRRAGLYDREDYGRWVFGPRTIQLLLLSLVGVFAYWAIKWGVAMPLQAYRAYRRGEPITWWQRRARGSKDQTLGHPFREILHAARGRGFLRDARFGGPADFLMDSLAGDVLTYVASCRQALPPSSELAGRAEAIVGRFHAALRRAHEDGCGEIQVVAHSLGTVVAYHGIFGYRLPECTGPPVASDLDPTARLTRLYTIGSPLEKIRFLWPQLFQRKDLGRVRIRAGAPCRALEPVPVPKWDNFVGRYDAVSGKLKRFGPRVVNHRVRGGGFLRSHTAYQRSPEFMDVLVEGLTERRVRRRSLVTRILRRVLRPLVLYFENLILAPNLLVILVLSGMFAPAGVVAAAAQGIAFLLHQGGMEHAAQVLPYAAFGITGALIAAGIVRGGRVRAPSVHARYTGAASRPPEGDRR